MKWILLISFMFVCGQAFSAVEFEKVHELSYQTDVQTSLIRMRPLKRQKLLPRYKAFYYFPKTMVALRK